VTSPVSIPALIGLPAPARPAAALAPHGALRAALARKPRLLGIVAPGSVSFPRIGIARPARDLRRGAAPSSPAASA